MTWNPAGLSTRHSTSDVSADHYPKVIMLSRGTGYLVGCMTHGRLEIMDLHAEAALQQPPGAPLLQEECRFASFGGGFRNSYFQCRRR